MSPERRSSASDSRRSPGGLGSDFALPSPESSDLSVSAWIEREDAVVDSRSEYDEDEDEPCSEAQQAHDVYDLSLSASRIAPARDLAVPGPSSAPRPLRC